MLRIILTSSRSPSSNLLKFLKELENTFPYSKKSIEGQNF